MWDGGICGVPPIEQSALDGWGTTCGGANCLRPRVPPPVGLTAFGEEGLRWWYPTLRAKCVRRMGHGAFVEWPALLS